VTAAQAESEMMKKSSQSFEKFSSNVPTEKCPSNTPKHKQIHKLLQLMFLLSFRSAFPSCWEATRVSGATASELQLPFHLEKSSSNMQCQRMLARPTSVEICSA